jgi:hypothetical protein
MTGACGILYSEYDRKKMPDHDQKTIKAPLDYRIIKIFSEAKAGGSRTATGTSRQETTTVRPRQAHRDSETTLSTVISHLIYRHVTSLPKLSCRPSSLCYTADGYTRLGNPYQPKKPHRSVLPEIAAILRVLTMPLPLTTAMRDCLI